MLPGFVDIYKDKEKYIHVFFFPGVSNNNDPIYKDIDMSTCNYKYDKKENSDNSIDIKFENKKIIKICCKLVSYIDNSEHIEMLNIS